ncbi:MAG TPA: MmcQ/YjbR family DNA-binding protein [Steroidobacteraceae bacterium]|nr:MmcQ/YjbR family DNA-binding protein [Steroidobacteraceae bacterium]
MARNTDQAVREACLWLPEAEEFLSHGSPNFRVRGKTFATYAVNHHGDGRVALWLTAPPGSQELHVRTEPKHFFVPPYVGPKGWLGVILDRGLDWERIAALVREGYEKVAPPTLRASLGKTPKIKRPERALSASDIDPFKSARALAVLSKLRKICLKFPESGEGSQFGHPTWRAGKKTFAIARFVGKRLTLCFWVGVDQQGLLTADPRYEIPPYFGHNGWIALDASQDCDWHEVQQLALQSYRHFALKRMLQLL